MAFAITGPSQAKAAQTGNDVRLEFVFPSEPEATDGRTKLSRLVVSHSGGSSSYNIADSKFIQQGSRLAITVPITETFVIGSTRLMVEETIPGRHLCLDDELRLEGTVVVARHEVVPTVRLQFAPLPSSAVTQVGFDCILCAKKHSIDALVPSSPQQVYNSTRLMLESDVFLKFKVELIRGAESFRFHLRPSYLAPATPLRIEIAVLADSLDLGDQRTPNKISQRVINARRADALAQLTEMGFKATVNILR